MQREVRLYLGKTGSGKTHLMRAHMAGLTRFLVLDADFNELPGTAHGTLEGLLDYLEARAPVPGGFFGARYTPRRDEQEIIMEAAKLYGPLTLVLEEADRFARPAESEGYDELIARGRHFGVGIWAASLYPFALPSELRRQATSIYAFRQHEPRDITWLREVMGESADELPHLGQFEYILWTPTDGAKKFGAWRG